MIRILNIAILNEKIRRQLLCTLFEKFDKNSFVIFKMKPVIQH